MNRKRKLEKCKHREVVIFETEEYLGFYNAKTNEASKIGNPQCGETTIICKKCEEELGADLI